MVKILETEKRIKVARGWRWGSGESLFNGSRASVLQDVRNYEDGCGGDGRTTSYVYLIPLNWAFKNGYNDKYYVYFNRVFSLEKIHQYNTLH